ncbi:MAG: type II toxin-antitoxin system HicA family toxin [Chthoniobacterales bacterium]
MPKLRVFSARALCALLQEHGFAQTRQSGSHIVMRKQMPPGARTVIVPNHNEIRRGTLKSIIEQSGLPRALFMN